MKNAFSLLFLIALSLSPVFAGATDSYVNPSDAPARVLKIAKEIPESKRDIIVQSFYRVRSLTQGLKDLPTEIEIAISERSDLAGAGALLDEGRIEIKPSAFELSDQAFETLLNHEFTHFVVAVNFRSKLDASLSLYDHLRAARSDRSGRHDSMAITIMAQEHSPYGELLSDVAAVMLNRNPRAIPQMVDDLYRVSAPDSDERRAIEKSMSDQPKELSIRDFTISSSDPRWQSYQPRDFTYNRFNQIRAYLWQRWIQNLQPGAEAQFFARFLKQMEQFYVQGNLDVLTQMNGLAATNSQLIMYLDKTIQ